MSRTLPAAITTGKVGNSERVILIRIIPDGGDAWTDLLWATKDITITGWEGGEDNKVFVGDVLKHESLGVIQESIDIELGGNVAKVSDFTFEIANPEYSGTDRFDETFDAYDLEGRTVEVRLAFWTGSNPAYSDIVLLHTFIVNDLKYDYQAVKIRCTDAGYQRHREIPDLILSKDDYSVIPVHNRGKVVPLAYGDLTSGVANLSTINMVPAMRINKAKEIFVIARNRTTGFSPVVYLYCNDVNRYVGLTPESSSFSLTQGRPTLLNFPLGADINGDLITQLEIQGSQTYPTSLNSHLAIDESDSTVAELDAGIEDQLLYLKAPLPAEFGKTATGTYTATLYVNFGTIPASPTSNGKIKYYDPETAAFTDLYTYDNTDSGDLVSVNITGKTWDELSSYEYGVTCMNGTCQIKNMYLSIAGVTVKMTQDRITVRFVGVRRRRGISVDPFAVEKPFNLLEEGDNVCLNLDGGQFSSWIDEDSRNNGYDENHLITRPPYIIESILRDELGLTSTDIDYASFDVLGNTTDGERKLWAFAGRIESQCSSLEAIRDICRQAGMIYLESYQNKSRVVSLIERISVKTVDRTTIHGNSIGIEKSKLEHVYNRFYLNYAPSWTTGGFNSTRYLTRSATNMTSNVRSGTPNTYTGLCDDSYDRIGSTDRRFNMDCGFISSDVVIDLLLKWLAEWLCYRKIIAVFDVSLDHIELELGDQIVIDHTLLPDAINNSAHFVIFESLHNLTGDSVKFKAMQIPSLLP